jgi:hypothetical protein
VRDLIGTKLLQAPGLARWPRVRRGKWLGHSW